MMLDRRVLCSACLAVGLTFLACGCGALPPAAASPATGKSTPSVLERSGPVHSPSHGLRSAATQSRTPAPKGVEKEVHAAPPPISRPTAARAQDQAPAFDEAKAYPLPEGKAEVVGAVTYSDCSSTGTVTTCGTVEATVDLACPGQAVVTQQTVGAFRFLPMHTTAHHPRVCRITASAPGYGTFVVRRVPLFDRQKVELVLTLPPAGKTVTNPGVPASPPGCCLDQTAPEGS